VATTSAASVPRGTPAVDGKRRVPLALAEAVAAEARARLAPACERLEVAGSIRRRRPDVGDVELVAVPRVTPGRRDLFGDATGEADELHALAERLLHEGVLAHRPDKNGRPAFGTKLKRVVFRGRAGELPLDLFAVTGAAQWGVIFTIRTGPGAFSTRLVTQRRYGGGMPEGHRVRDGALWDGERLVETPEEADLFRALGLPWLPPERRTDTVRPVRRDRAWAWHDPAAPAAPGTGGDS
jgi:DNA polymerase/3'-5' exonuclease PolX